MSRPQAVEKGIRFLPLRDLQRLYVQGGRSRMGGFWVPAEAVAGLGVPAIVRALGLGYSLPDGSAPFDGAWMLGALVFPVTPEVRAATTAPVSAGAGGRLPDPPLSVRHTGNGFAPGDPMIPELRMALVDVPSSTEACRVEEDGELLPLMRWLRRGWVPA